MSLRPENNEVEQQIAACLRLLKGVLGQDLLGVYVYGSSIVGGVQKYSDLDLFVVSRRATTHDEKATLGTRLVSISRDFFSLFDKDADQDLSRPVELMIVVQSEIKPWRYPPTFDFQYGDWLRKDFESGNVEPWASKIMPDLALLITQVRLAHKTILGPAPDQLLPQVPYDDFMTASVKELDSLMADIGFDTRNVLLTLARIWSTVETDAIRSKSDAAAWVLDRLPMDFQPVMQRARAVYLGEDDEHWDDLESLVQPCADFMVGKIRERMAKMEDSDHRQRTITLAS
ncbi:MAG: DUF4111 domain-containing protein [Anaerolineae bacterium]|nr:DUF4111 domain-containing protein [Anaerolineae bacterium]